jgi:hypothetical protein
VGTPIPIGVRNPLRKIHLAGWFSFEKRARNPTRRPRPEVVMRALDARGWQCDVAPAEPFREDVRWEVVGRDDYDSVCLCAGRFSVANSRSASFTTTA